MNREQRIAFLSRVRLFEGLSYELLDRLAEGAADIRLAPGEILFREGDPGTDLYLVREGELAVLVDRGGPEPRRINGVGPYECVGEMGLFAAGNRLATVRAESAARLMRIERESFQALLDQVPDLKRVLGRVIEQRLPKLRAVLNTLFGDIDDSALREIEGTLSWRRLARGQVLFREGERGEDLYLIVHGRLQVSKETEGRGTRVIGELGPGEWVGEMTLLDMEPRSATVTALRDTDLLGLSREGFDRIVRLHPGILLPMVKVLSRRLRSANEQGFQAAIPPRSLTVAIVPMTPLPSFFLEALSEEFARSGHVLVLSAAAFDEVHGRGSSQTTLDDPRSGHLSSWLSSIEDEYDYVIYVADQPGSEWARRCARHADRVLYSTAADADGLADPQRQLRDIDLVDVPKAVVFWHESAAAGMPSRTRDHLDRFGIRQHHHLRRGSVEDVKRLGRFLMGRPIGLCLSGGGARGFAHIGVYRALREAGTSIDRIGGTSIGGFIAALIACQYDYQRIVEHARSILAMPDSFGYTVPLLSLLQVRNAERRLKEAFAGSDFEDTWVDCFCCCTNLSNSQLEVVRSGPIWRAIRATTAVPGLCPPVFIKGDVFVDGAVLDNLPVDIMLNEMPGPIIACDVTKASALRVNPSMDATPSIFSLLAQRLRRRRDGTDVPSIGDILMRTMDCSSRQRQRTNLRAASAYLTPPVGDYRLLDMQHFDLLVEAGYRYASEYIQQHGLADIYRYRSGPGPISDDVVTGGV